MMFIFLAFLIQVILSPSEYKDNDYISNWSIWKGAKR